MSHLPQSLLSLGIVTTTTAITTTTTTEMGRQAQLLELLPVNYGYVVFVAVDSIFVNMWMARNVGLARKKYNIPLCY